MDYIIEETVSRPEVITSRKWPLRLLTVGTHFVVTDVSRHRAVRSAVSRFNKHNHADLHCMKQADGSLLVCKPAPIQRPTEEEWIAYCNSMSPCQSVTLKSDNQSRFARLASLLAPELFEIVLTNETMSVTHR